MLLWSWNELVRAAELMGDPAAKQLTLLFDELESHLHPRWQRTILSSLLHVADSLHDEASVQLIAATHSPLILASAEPFFDSEQDAWFDLDLERKNVVLRRRDFVRRGEVSTWIEHRVDRVHLEPRDGLHQAKPGCKHCYAERMAERLQAMGQPNYRNGFQLALQPQMLELSCCSRPSLSILASVVIPRRFRPIWPQRAALSPSRRLVRSR